MIKVGTGPGSWLTLFVYIIIFRDIIVTIFCIIKELVAISFALLALRRQEPDLLFLTIISPGPRIDVAFGGYSVKSLSQK